MRGLIETGPKMLSIRSKTFKLRVWKVEKQKSLHLDAKSIIFVIFAILDLLS